MPHKGACLCGQTTVELASTHVDQVVCHCNDCKQNSGSAFSTSVVALNKDVSVAGPVKEFRIKAASGNIVTHVFCSNCGSQIAHRSPAFGDAQAVLTGNLSDFAEIPITTEVFVKDRWTVLAPIPGAAQVEGMP
ncbi:Mss4-like protein [Mycena latifolia]|nr:Mss4-like protein [Mycena latifolia]